MEDLGRRLMKRIGEEVPVLPVPAVAHVLIAADGPVTRHEIERQIAAMVEVLPGTRMQLPRDDTAYAVEVGLRNLRKRGMLVEDDQGITVNEDDRPVVAYYAKSIAHLLCTRSD